MNQIKFSCPGTGGQHILVESHLPTGLHYDWDHTTCPFPDFSPLQTHTKAHGYASMPNHIK